MQQTLTIASITRNIKAQLFKRVGVMAKRRKPVHPGKVFRLDVLEPLGLSVTAAAGMMDISRKHLSDFVNEKVSCSVDLSIRIAHATDTSVASWLNLQTNLDVWNAEQIPKNQLRSIKRLRTAVV